MGFQVDLVTGIGQLLHAGNVGKWGGPFIAADTAIVIDALGSTPDKGIALTVYDVENGGGTDTVMGLQCRVRGTPGNRTTAKDILDRLFDALHGLEHTTIGGVPVVRIWWQSGAPLGTDATNRQEYTANYYIQLTRPGTNRTD